MLSQHETLLKSISIFADLSSEELAIAVSRMRERTERKGSVLFREGDDSRELFIILEGRVAITVKPSGSDAEIQLADMGSGTFFGEMSLVEDLPRSATCRITEKSLLLALDHAGLADLMEKHSAIAEKILYRMLTTTASRLHNTSALLSDMVQWGENARLRVITDDMTGLFNRRFLDETLETDFRKALSNHTPFSLAMIDLDRFGEINRERGEAFADSVIKRAADAFRSAFAQGDIIARYGGDEFTVILPGVKSDEALARATRACEAVTGMDFPEVPGFRVTASIGIASYPEHAQTVETLRERADKALYAAKEAGRACAMVAQKGIRQKHNIASIAERNRIIARILDVIQEKDAFLLLGHELPDEDCISSLVSMALLITKFGKRVTIYIRDQIPDQLSYLANICSYNKIPLVQGPSWESETPEAIFILDTPKPEMIALNDDIQKFIANGKIPIVEFDHHLSADAAYSGTQGYCFVMRASSTCEIIGFFCCKLSERPEVLAKYGITELFSRNIVLSMITGMIGDTKFGITMKTNRDAFFYKLFSEKFAMILRKAAHRNSGNYSSMHDIFKTMESFSFEEKDLYQKLLENAHYSGRTGYVVLDSEESQNYLSRTDYSLFVKVIKSVTDFLSEKSGTIGLTAYYDMNEVSDLVQFRIRTSREVSGIDLRGILLDFSITDGGGHPGAVGFRIKKSEIGDFAGYVKDLLKALETV
jgi:diguanylate cyclase (GGDEF)-like protein